MNTTESEMDTAKTADMQKAGSAAKKLGIGLFLFFFIKGLVWLVIFGAAAFGITSL